MLHIIITKSIKHLSREEFDQHGIGKYITSKCADACKDGFGLENIADAGFSPIC